MCQRKAASSCVHRANHYGWPNTYVFTKALGEMLLGHLKGDLPLVILRPTIITSTYKEPFPGWVEGIRTIDSLVVGYGKGRLACFLGDPEAVYDVVPTADMVTEATANIYQTSQVTEEGSTEPTTLPFKAEINIIKIIRPRSKGTTVSGLGGSVRRTPKPHGGLRTSSITAMQTEQRAEAAEKKPRRQKKKPKRQKKSR